MKLFCGIDFGTSNTKAVLLDDQMLLLDRITLPVKQSFDIDAELIWLSHFKNVIQYFKSKGLLDYNKVCCSITSQGGTFVFLDKKFRPITEPISWLENASMNTVKSLADFFTPEEYYRMTGWEPHPWLAVFKIKERLEKNKLSGKLRYVSMIPEYIHAQLTGRFITDVTNAQITGLCDFRQLSWSEGVMNWAGLKTELLPQICSKPEIILEKLDIEGVKIDIFTSSHDQYALMHAADIQVDRDVLLGTGTAWVLNGRVSEPLYKDDFSIHPGRDIDEGCYGFIQTFGPVGNDFDKLLTELNIDYSHFSELRSQFPSLGIDVFSMPLCDNVDNKVSIAVKNYMDVTASKVLYAIERLGLDYQLQKLIMTGGATASSYWPQAIANLTRMVIETVDFPEMTALGAAKFARSTLLKVRDTGGIHWPKQANVRYIEPKDTEKYREWYTRKQKPILIKELSRS
ncbi:MAG: hypothetical protein A2Y12_18370 [Planctomycetes bacterium GWF2_42_9]|nr:MAG: hypothetical protein A2Y12_18370 [Planctomycetes bacterium GWF2_42_9]